MKYPIGSWVQYAVPEGHDSYRIGRVVEYRTLTDFAGCRSWYNVRFIDSEGTPDKDAKTCEEAELVLMTQVPK